MSPSVMSLPLLYPKTLETDVLGLKYALLVVTFPYDVMSFDIEIIHQKIQATRSHASHCHYCNDDFVLFRNGTCQIYFLFSFIHVNIANFLNIMCTLVATDVVLGRLYCSPISLNTCLSSICSCSHT